MFYSNLLTNVASMLALSGSLVNPTPALAAEVPTLDNSSQNTPVVSVSNPVVNTDIGPATVIDGSGLGEPDRVVQAEVSAYTSTPGQTDDSPFIAATGKRVHDGMIAVNDLPFGTKIKIPAIYGDKVFLVEDRMNRRYSCQTSKCNMDVWLDTTRAEALKFGRRHVEAEIYLPDTQIAAK